MKNRILFLSLFCLLIGLVAANQGCKKDDNSTAPAAPTNSFAFNTEDGNFAASGAYNPYATSGSGAGWMSSSIIAAYSMFSPTDASVVLMMFMATPSVRTFNFPTESIMIWSLHVNPNDTGSIYSNQCLTKAGSVVIGAHGGGTSQATFIGSGVRVRNEADTCAITNGAFTIYGGSAKAMALPPEVERIARRIVEQASWER